MCSWSRVIRASLYASSIVLAGGLARPVRASEGAATNSASNLWLLRTWQTDEGLPDNNVTGVAQTSDGHLWVATLGGLMRFDGQRFEALSTTHLPKVPNRVVLAMYLDRRGQFWLVMERGVVIRSGHSDTCVFDASDGLAYTRGPAIGEDNAEGVWFGCGNEVCGIRNDKVKCFGTNEGLPPGGNISLATDAQGQLWFACGSQVGIFREEHWQTLRTADSNPVHLAASRSAGMWVSTGTSMLKLTPAGEPQRMVKLPAHVMSQVLLEDHTGAVWIGTGADGLWRLEDNEWERIPVSHSEITALTEDREGNLWVGTAGGGLNMLRPRAMHLIGAKAGLPFESIRSVCQDSDGTVWAALQNGSLARGHGNEWQPLTSADGWPGGAACCVAPDRAGGVWIGTRDRGLQRWRAGKTQTWDQRHGLGNPVVRSILQARNGDLWVTTDGPSRLWLLQSLSPSTGERAGVRGSFVEAILPTEVRSIRALTEAADGTVWAGTSDGQILRIEGGKVVNEAGAQKGPPYSVRCLHTTADGSLWIGYAGWGIGWWRGGRYSRVTTAQGLYDDYVSEMISDAHGGLWLAGNHGLFQVPLGELVDVAEGRRSRLRSIAYGRGEGLPSLQPVYENSPTAWRSEGGQLFFSTRKGVLAVYPDKIRDNPVPPAVFVEQVRIDDRLVGLFESHSPLRTPDESKLLDLHVAGQTLRLPPRHSKIEFVFTALSFNSPENVQFRHRLKRFDTEWVEAGTQRVARYPRLPAGNYEFEVTACNEAGVWSPDGFRFPFTVQPFYWQTWWFRIGVVALFTACLIGLVRYVSFRRLRRNLARLEQAETLHRERARIARDMHDEVGSKLSRLTLLSELAAQQAEMPTSARAEVGEISETARDTIRSFDEIVWAVNPRNDSLPELMNYLCRFAEDFFEGSATQCVFEVPPVVPEIELPTDARHQVFLAAKEALNNVLKHAEARQVRISLTVQGDGFEIGIEDDGRGINGALAKPRAGSGNGLNNMRERMNSVGGQMHIDSHNGAGTRVHLRVRAVQKASA